MDTKSNETLAKARARITQIDDSNVIALSIPKELVPASELESIRKDSEVTDTVVREQRATLAAMLFVEAYQDAKDVIEASDNAKAALARIPLDLARPLQHLWSNNDVGIAARIKEYDRLVQIAGLKIATELKLPDLEKSLTDRLSATQVGRLWIDYTSYVRIGLREGVDFYASALEGKTYKEAGFLYENANQIRLAAKAVQTKKKQERETKITELQTQHAKAIKDGNAEQASELAKQIHDLGGDLPSRATAGETEGRKGEGAPMQFEGLPEHIAKAFRRILGTLQYMAENKLFEPMGKGTGLTRTGLTLHCMSIFAAEIGNISNISDRDRNKLPAEAAKLNMLARVINEKVKPDVESMAGVEEYLAEILAKKKNEANGNGNTKPEPTAYPKNPDGSLKQHEQEAADLPQVTGTEEKQEQESPEGEQAPQANVNE